MQALCEHTAAYDGYGSAVAEYSTIGAQEVIEMLDEDEILEPVLQAALSADLYNDLGMAAGALEVRCRLVPSFGVSSYSYSCVGFGFGFSLRFRVQSWLSFSPGGRLLQA